MTRSFPRELGAALADDLAIVVGALIDTQAQVGVGAPTGGPQWKAEVLVSGAASGTCTIAFDAAAASSVTALIMGLGGQVPAEAVIDTFRELCSQALSALSLKPVAGGATFTVGSLTHAAELEPGDGWAVYGIAADKLAEPLTITVWGSLTAAGQQPSTPAAAPRPVPAPPPVTASPSGDRLEVILDIDLPLVVRFGRTELPLRSLTRVGPGSLIDLGRSPDDPVEILVSNRVVARGEVVIVSGNYGVRILDVVSPRDRM